MHKKINASEGEGLGYLEVWKWNGLFGSVKTTSYSDRPDSIGHAEHSSFSYCS